MDVICKMLLVNRIGGREIVATQKMEMRILDSAVHFGGCCGKSEMGW